MKNSTVKTSVTLEPKVLEGARQKVEENGQSVSSYINLLIRRDLAIEEVPAKKTKTARAVQESKAA